MYRVPIGCFDMISVRSLAVFAPLMPPSAEKREERPAQPEALGTAQQVGCGLIVQQHLCDHTCGARTGGQSLEPAQQLDEGSRFYVVVHEKHDHVIQGSLCGLSIHLSRVITAVDASLVLLFEFFQPVAQRAQRCELGQFLRQRFQT